MMNAESLKQMLMTKMMISPGGTDDITTIVWAMILMQLMSALFASFPEISKYCVNYFQKKTKNIEAFKQLNKKPTPLQAKHHQLLASKKIIVYVIDNVELGKEIIDYEYINKGAKHHWNAVRNIDGN